MEGRKELFELPALLGSLLVLLSNTAASTVVSYEYDAAGRLVAADYGDKGRIEYAYDAGGSLVWREVVSLATYVLRRFGRPGVKVSLEDVKTRR